MPRKCYVFADPDGSAPSEVYDTRKKAEEGAQEYMRESLARVGGEQIVFEMRPVARVFRPAPDVVVEDIANA